MKIRQIIAASAIAFAAFGISAANAKVFDFSFTTATDTASGQFVTGPTGSPYAVTGISGTFDSNPITGLSAYASADNQLYVPATIADGYGSSPFYADVSGISFSSGGIDYNISDYSGNTLNNSVADPGGSGCCGVNFTSFSVTAVPEPLTLSLFGAGLAGAAALRRRKKKTA